MKTFYFRCYINKQDRSSISVIDKNKNSAYAQLVEHFGKENIENKVVVLKYLSSEKI